MLYVMEWKVKDGCTEKAVNKFLDKGEPMPEESKLIGRYHAPGSVNGWLIVETENPTTLYYHALEWAELLHWNTTPVLTDEEAGATCASLWKVKN